jgi:NAD(P)-dependent dehydrogenase (short-subunit alcohol dehydrogenase family)
LRIINGKRLDIFVPNAGIGGQAESQLSNENLETLFVTNHLGHFKMYLDLEDLILKAAEQSNIATVVAVASAGNFQAQEVILSEDRLNDPKKFSGFQSYCHSKLYNSTFHLFIFVVEFSN